MIVSPPMRSRAEIAVAMILTALLSSCGQSGSNAPKVTHAVRSSQSKTAAAQPDRPAIDPDMVSAVNVTGTSSTLLSMKFEVQSRPVVTAPLQVRVLMIPAADAEITRIHVLFQPGDGLELQSERNLELTDLTAGTPVEQQVTVVPRESGVLSLSATVLVDTPTESISRTYAIPLIASDGHS
jgi:hypothetical protein